MAKLKVSDTETIEIEMVARWGRNGQKYVWVRPDQRKLDYLVRKYGVGEISSGSIEGKKVNLVWLEW